MSKESLFGFEVEGLSSFSCAKSATQHSEAAIARNILFMSLLSMFLVSGMQRYGFSFTQSRKK
jgi:hypothetical protein